MMKVSGKLYRWQMSEMLGNNKIRVNKIALLAIHLLLFFTPVFLMAQPTVGTTTFDGLISGTTNYATGAGSASVSDVLSTGWNFTVDNLNGTSTAAVQGLDDVGDDNGTIDDDVISLSAGGGLNMEYVSFESNDGSEFQLQTFKLYYLSSGNTEIIVAGYKDGSEVVSVSQGTLTSNSWNTIDVSSNTSFDNVDEIRITNGSPNVAIIRIDDISIAAAVASNTAPSFTAPTADYGVFTAVANNELDISAQEGGASGMFFNNTGSKLFVIGTWEDTVFEYQLSTAYDVSSASYSGNSFSVSAQTQNPEDVSFNNDGSKMYIVGGGFEDSIFEYDLSTPFDITTASYNNNSLDLSSQETGPTGMKFDSDGDSLFIIGSVGDEVNSYALSTPFDVTTASYISNLDISSYDGNSRGLTFDDSGDRLFIIGNSRQIREFSLSEPYTLSGGVFSGNSRSLRISDVLGLGKNPGDVFFKPDGSKVYIVHSSAIYELNLAPTVSFNENGSGVVTDVQAHDGNGGANDANVTYSLSGTDAADFTIDSDDGELRFVAIPDFENPADDGADNMYNITVTADDGAGSNNTTDQAITITVTDVDEIAPTFNSAGSTPTDDATGVSTTNDIVMDFSENIVGGNGNVILRDVTGASNIELFDASSASATSTPANGEVGILNDKLYINPSSQLSELNAYSIRIDAAAIDDANGNSFAGINDDVTYNFTTADETGPTFNSAGSTPNDDATGVAVGENIVIDFDENIAGGTGNITIRDVTGSTNLEVFDITIATATSSPGSGGIGFLNDKIYLNPTTDLSHETTYSIRIDATAIDDASGNSFAGITDDVTLNFTTATAVGFTVTESDGTTSTSETGTSDSFTVVLDAQPASDVVININSDDTGEGTVDQSMLTFTNANWDTPQTVTVTGVDDDLIDGTINYNITLAVDDASSDDAYDGVADQSVDVDNADDDVAGFTVTESDGTTEVSEAGTTDDFTIVLDAEPASNVVIDITPSDYTEGTADVASVTFTPANWSTPQTVTMTGQDDNLIDGDQVFTVTLLVNDGSSDDDFDAVADQTVSVTTTDDEVAGFTVTESDGTTEVSELGTTDDFTVVLDAQPASDVVILVSSDDTGEATVSVASLTFTNANWNTPQTITVTGQDDSDVDGDQTTTVTLSIDDANTDDGFDAIVDQTVSVTTTDDDAPVAGFTITESDGTTSTSETGTTDSFTVVLDAQPASDVVITVSSRDTGEGTVDVASVTFTPSNWDTPQTVTVTGVDDDLIDGSQSFSITLSINDANSDDDFDALADQNVDVDNTDDDVAGFTIAESDDSTSVSETGTEDSFTVVLDAEPSSNVVIDVTSGDTGEGTASLSSLTFTPANWDTPQTVTITGVDDDLIDSTQTFDITLSINGGSSDDDFDGVADQTVSVDNTDDEVAGFTITESDGNTTTSELGTTDEFTVVFDAEPSSNVVINVTSGDTGEGTIDNPILTFTPANWNTPQIVTVSGVDDDVLDGTVNYDITLAVDSASSDDAFDAVTDQTVSVTNTDDEAIQVSINDTTVTEGTSGTAMLEFTVSLSAPAEAGGVNMDYSTADNTAAAGDDYTAASGTIIFAEGESAKTISVTVNGDQILESNETFTITLSNLSGSNVEFGDTIGIGTITNDDTATVTISNVSGDEDDGEITLTAVLDNAVQGGFTVDLSTSDSTATVADGDYTALSGETLTFTGSGGESKEVTVTLTSDSKVEDDETLSIVMSNLASTSLSIDITDGATVTILNDDTAGFTVTESDGTTMTNEEGTTDDITVVLSAQPGSNVVIHVTSGDTGEGTIDNPILTFTPANWNTPQTVTVSGVDDSDVDSEQSFDITLAIDDASSDDYFDALPDQTISVTNTDDDAVLISVNDTTVAETNSTLAFTISLSESAPGDITVDYALSDGSATTSDNDYTAASGTVAFNTGESSKTVNVTLTDDSKVEADETFLIYLSNNTGPSLIADTTGTGIITNDDEASVTIADVTVDEEDGTATFIISLDNAVDGGFTVELNTSDSTATIADGDYIALSGEIATFSGTAGETEEVSVTINTDSKVEANELVKLALSSLNTATVDSSVIDITDTALLTITNDDQATLLFTDNSGEEDAGDIQVTVTLNNPVQDGFTVDVSTSDSSAAIADNDYTALLGNTLTFAGTVGETQQFNFTPTGDDKVEADEIATLSFSNLSTSLDVDITDKGFVTISNDDNAPLFTSEDSVDVAENKTTVLTVVASDLDGMSIAYSITGGVDESLFSIDASSGVLTFDDAPDFENPTDSDTNNEYKLTVEASDGTNAVTQDIVISVTDVDDITPVFTSQDIFTINENEISVATITASDGDAISTVTFEISDGVDSSFFDINSQTGVLTFETGRDYESPADSNTDNVYEVQITATDGTKSVTQDISVSISDVNEFSPVFISEADTNLTEGNLEVLTIIATDADTADTIMYLISGGADASLFSIDSSEGLLSFNSAPDFESPDDTGTDNEYNIEVTATDGTNNTVQLFTISVSDLNEFTPVITSDATAIVYEGMNEGTELLTVTSSDGDGTSVVSYSITSNVNPNGNGTDAFAINSTTGLITLADPDDINKQENPELTIHIQANDGQFTANQTITITVLTPPVAESISPENGAEDIPLTGQVSVTFDQDVQTIDLSGISIVDGNDNAVTGLTSSLTDSTISISYQGLANFTIYTVTIPAGAVENEDGVGNLEVQWQFTTIVDVPEQVVLLAPIGGAGSVSVQPTFVWETIERSESAIFQISTDSLFATDVIELDGNTAAEISLSDPLDFYETYYWRVRGVNVGGEGPWSDKGVFVTEAAVPQLTFPINGATGISTAPNIKWSSSHQGTSFEFHFDHTGAFTDLLRDLRPDSTNIQLQGLEANTDYFWRVRVFDDITSSAWSEIRSFTTRPDPEETEDDPIEVTISFGGGPSDTTSAGGGQQTNREVVQTDYRMVGLPGTDQIRLDEFFEGPYKKSWRAFVETGDDLNFYDEYSPEDERFVFVPGLGFWVLSTEIVADQYNFTPVHTNVNDSYGIYMHPGWNIIANPYRSPVEWELVREFNDITGELYGYEEQFQIEDTMEVLKGYYYYNPPALDMDTLFIPYTGFSQRGIEDENDKVSTNEMSRVVVEANLEGKVKHNIEIVYSDTAEKYRKQLHTYHPELGFAKTGLVMSKDELQNKAKLNRTLDSYNPEGQEYNLELKTKVGSSIIWKADFNKLPDDAAILLVNKATNEAQLIHYDEVFRVKASEPVSKYTLYVGDRSYLKEIEQSLIPDKVELRQNYPNPFNPQTTINYALAEEVSVHIEVYDILGRLVATLVNNETQKAGWHKVAFDGSRLASGVYFYRLNAGKEVRLGKMTLIK